MSLAASTVAHLTTEAAAFLDSPPAERIFEIRRDHWVGYPRAKEALLHLEDLLNHPRTLGLNNLLLVGPSGIGKTTIIHRFVAQNPIQNDVDGHPIRPVLLLNMPVEPSEGRFWSAVLRALNVSYRETDKPQTKMTQALEVLRMVQCRMVIVDEIHNVLTGGPKQQRAFLTLLKELDNALQAALVCVGTNDAVMALATDSQTDRRFVSFGLRKLPAGKAFQAFVATYERRLPLAKPSGLGSRELATAIYRGSNNGLISDATRIMREAAVAAVRSGEEQITLRTIESLPQLRLTDPRAGGGRG